MEQTANYGLSKPEKTDSVSIDVLNENMDKVDTALRELSQETAASIHGSGHAIGGADPITPDMIGAADNALSNLPDPAAALTNLGAAGNPNLVDNWYLADPIDQRQGYVIPPDTPYYSDTALTAQAGTVSAYTTASKVNDACGTITVDGTTYYVDWTAAVRGYTGVYGIDRWRVWGSVPVLIRDDFISIVNPDNGAGWYRLAQHLDHVAQLNGKAHTMSVLYRSDKNFSFTIHSPTKSITCVDNKCPASPDKWTVASFSFLLAAGTFDSGDTGTILLYPSVGDTIDIKAIKLEPGATQTLAHRDADGNWVLNDPPPDRAAELLKCCMSAADASDAYANNKVTPSAVGAAVMEVVSYVGTGLHGAANPCQATFSFAPKLVLGLFAVGSSGAASFFPSATNYNDYSVSVDWAMLPEQMTTQWQSGAGLGRSDSWGSYWLKQYGKKSADGKTLYWYQDDDGLGDSEGASFQLNTAGTTYYLIAFS